jgi:hypothetical protein
MRNARKLSNGNYLVAHYGLNKVCEYDCTAKLIRTIPIKGGPHSVIRIPNGNTLIACSDHDGDPQIIEIDSTDSIVWQLKKNELPGIELKFMAGMEIMPNGNIVLTNWLGHSNSRNSPHAFEITRDKKIIWKYENFKQFQTISNIQILANDGSFLSNTLH